MRLELTHRRRFLGSMVAVLIGIAWVCPAPVCAEPAEEFFESKIRPLLTERCLGCHSSEAGKTQGGLALDTRRGWEKGGESGTAILPANVDGSLLIQAVLYSPDGPQMPPEEAGGKLSDAEIALLKQWIQQGAFDPRTEVAKRGGMTEAQLRAWWSFQPLQPGTVPVTNRPGVRYEIDQFLLARLSSEGLEPTPEADRRTLIRRATYDLTGLPPTPEEVEAFQSDESPTAYEAMIERLLESPQYGEHWGRHWLDVVRYADTAGENSDHPIPDAWRYRNWVIAAFNRDMPYDQFVREQFAGDLLHANESGDTYAEGVTSTGFLAIARRFDHDADKFMHLTIEDTIDTMGKAFLGLSIACARCHDHKYDPISAHDYYALYGILNSTRYAFPGCEAKQQPRDLVPLLSPSEWAQTIEPYDRALAAIDAEAKPLSDIQAAQTKEFQSVTASVTQPLARGDLADGGTQRFHEVAEIPLKSVDVKVGQMIQLTIDPAGNYGADSTLIEWEITELEGQQRKWNLTEDVISDFLAANPHADRFGNRAVWLFLDGRGGPSLLAERVTALNGQAGLSAWRSGDNPAVFVNSTNEAIQIWTKLPARTLFVHPAPDGPVALAWVSPIEGRVQIRGRIEDAHPGGPNGVGWSIDQISGDHSAAVQRLAETGAKQSEWLARRAELVTRAPIRPMAYAVTEGTIADARVHLRGDVEKLGEVVPRRWLELFGGEAVPQDAGSGRVQLGAWISAPTNPLTARVMVNRIWQQHFGKGLVQTPNDFGTRGQRPTHPELLDWLAVKFIESGWSIKSMHRLIMHSAAYRRSSEHQLAEEQAKAMTSDTSNTLYWRFNRQRLNAEQLRDSLLALSQQLDLQPGAAHAIPAPDKWSFTQHVPFAGVAPTDKRSVYQLTVRNRRDPFMSLFDGADPNATTPQRQVTTVPTQSLYFLNDAFYHGQAEKIARRVLDQPDDPAKVASLFRIVLLRAPTADEHISAATFLTHYRGEVGDASAAEQPAAAWSALARVLLASNEFLYLD